MNSAKEIVKKYSPYIYFDENEPFFPVKVGYSIFDKPGESKSFNRKIEFDTDSVDFAIEYAIYWDYDIQHLYELEHVWIYIDKNEKLVDGEASFHGRYLKALLKDKSNIEDETHMRVYSQPGKHAFFPKPEYFELIPDLRTATYERAGNSGLIVTSIFKGIYETNEDINRMVEDYLKKFKFKPAMRFRKYVIPDNIFITWEELFIEIPQRIADRLEEIRKCN
ncbi:MAG: hypothetical protein HPY74_10665 [Firmicutes bacterium]|nr:hypothetical protein [Bacillota bacterium]